MDKHIPRKTDYSGHQIDVEALQSIARPVDIERVTLSIADRPPKVVGGVQKLVQRYAITFLSVIRDVHFDPDQGSEFMRQVFGGRIQDMGRLLNVFAESNLRVIQQLKSDDNSPDVFGEQPDDEKIEKARLLDADINYATQTIMLRVALTTAGGDKIEFLVPAQAPR